MVGSESVQTATRLLLEKVKSTSSSESASGDTPKASVDWSFGKSTATTPVAQKLGNDVQLQLKHRQDVSSVTWHKKGDYFATVCPDGRRKRSAM